jgi:phage gp36-like protein
VPYATRQDMLDRESEDLIHSVFDRDRDGLLDEPAIDQCLADASGEMDGYIGQRHSLPLATPPSWGKQICIDIGIYRGARSADALTNELRARYEDAVDFLKQVARGNAGLGLAASEQPTGDSGEVKGGDILISSQPRLFGRGPLRRLP